MLKGTPSLEQFSKRMDWFATKKKRKSKFHVSLNSDIIQTNENIKTLIKNLTISIATVSKAHT